MIKFTPPHRSLLLLLALCLTIGLSTLGFLLVTLTKSQMPNDTDVMARLNTLQSQLTTLEHSINKPLPKEITQLSERLEHLKKATADELNQTITHTEATLSNQLDSIQTVVNHLDAKASPTKYLRPENLPFNIVSLDSIQQIPVASIAYDFKIIPLEKNDVMAGWTLISLDYGKQRLEFENTKKERVLITHEQIG